jgi:hypothetical protein
VIVKSDLSHESIRVESGGGSRIEEGDESARLLGEDTDVFDRTESYLREEFVD